MTNPDHSVVRVLTDHDEIPGLAGGGPPGASWLAYVQPQRPVSPSSSHNPMTTPSP